MTMLFACLGAAAAAATLFLSIALWIRRVDFRRFVRAVDSGKVVVAGVERRASPAQAHVRIAGSSGATHFVLTVDEPVGEGEAAFALALGGMRPYRVLKPVHDLSHPLTCSYRRLLRLVRQRAPQDGRKTAA